MLFRSPNGTTKLPGAPTPPTNQADTIIYYVSQISNDLFCEGDKLPVVAIISDLPSPAVNPYSQPICPDEMPTIVLPVTDSAYTYDIYDDPINGNLICSGTGTGDTIRIQGTVALPLSTVYYIEIINFNGCNGLSRTPVNIPVVSSPVEPITEPVNVICLYTIADTLKAEALPGHFLQWYDHNGNPLTEAPVPPTNKVDTITYYVSQISDDLNCESAKKSIEVIISDLPGLIPNAQSLPVCPHTKPEIIIPVAENNYTYKVYSHSIGGRLLAEGVGTGGSLTLYADTTLVVSTVFYIETLNEYLCEGLKRTPVGLTVVDSPVKPMADPAYIVCLNSQADPLTAIALNGHHLQWYDTDGITPLSAAPTPPTNRAGTITYYVAQISDNLSCESEKIPTNAIISDLPSHVANPLSPIICPGMYPVINIPLSYDEHTYKVYTKSTNGQLVGEMKGNGEAISIPTSEPVMSSTTYYIETLNENLCAGDERTSVEIIVENYLYIKPDTIPPYERGVQYRVQLQTNAAPPYVFTALESLPLGFQLSQSGEITGTAPRNGKIDPTPFTVQVVDNDGCMAIKQYELTSDVFAPQVFTPNGDGVNDHFMKGKRLIVFDRLGIKVFEGDDGWDGTYNGKPAPPDTYFYVIFYIDYTGIEAHKTGYITLLRRK